MQSHIVKVTAASRSATVEVYRIPDNDPVAVEVHSARSWSAAPIYCELKHSEARHLAETLLAFTEGALIAQVQAADAEAASLLAPWLSLADADRVTELERTTEKRLAAWARQMLNLPVPGATGLPKTIPVEIEWHPDYRGGAWGDMGEVTIIPVPIGPDGVTDDLVQAAFRAQLRHDPICIIRWVEDPDWAVYDPNGTLTTAESDNTRRIHT